MKNKSIVTKITKFEKKPGFTDTPYLIEFRNGDRGYYNSKVDEQTSFIPNQEVEYDIEEKLSGAGKAYFKITLPGEAKPFVKGGGKPVQDPRAQFIGFSAAYAKDLVVAGKVSIDNMNAFSDTIFKNMMRLYETIKN